MIERTTEAFELLKKYLIDNFGAKVASGGKEVIKRCHICGDSRDKSDAHMYIGMRNDGLICYNCFKCNHGGIVDGLFLRNMGCYDTNVIMSVSEQNKSIYNTSNGYMKSQTFINNNPLYDISYDEITKRKIDYLEKRIGLCINAFDAKRFKIILNLKRFLDLNNISNYTRYPDIINLLNKYFIGFLSMDNKYIILRRIIPEGNLPKNIDTRYVNYNIYGLENGSKFYTIPSNIYTNLPIDIHISEGIMDILSVKNNLIHNENSIHSAICGKSYSSIVRYFIVNYGFINFNLHLYMDNDVSNSSLSKIINDVSIYNDIKIFIHRNSFQNEKDYGVPNNRIIDSFIQIK